MPSISNVPNIPPEVREALNQPRNIGGIVSRHGGADPNSRGLIANSILQNPSVQAHNAYVSHLKEKTIGYVTFLGTVSVTETGEVIETVHQYKSANGESRTLLRFISEPIYFDGDWEHFLKESNQRNPIFITSDRPLNAARLERRAELLNRRAYPLGELMRVAEDLKIKGTEKLQRERLIEVILDREFPENAPEDKK